MSLPRFIDFEASSLSGKSYPIEVAWSDQEGNIESWLINPEHYPASWTDWDPRSERIHGLSRAYLAEHGKPPLMVAKRMNQQLQNQVLYSDAPEYDGVWLRRLFEAAGVNPEFRVANATKLLYSLHPEYVRFSKKAREKAGGIHRSACDVSYLVALYRFCLYNP